MPIDTPEGATAADRVSVASVVGALVGGLVAATGAWRLAPVAAWDVIAAIFLIWVWVSVWRLDAAATKSHATRDDPGRITTDIILTAASVASLGAVGLLLVEAGDNHGTQRGLLIGLAVASVVLSWVVVHTVFMLHYARRYYSEPVGGIDFSGDPAPQYSDFAYLAFTLGMTFQVSDTTISAKPIRADALRQSLLAYVFGAVILATSINAVASLLN